MLKLFTPNINPIVPLVWISCSIVALVGILFGMDIGVISGVLPFITKEFHLSTNMAGWIVGSMMGGASIGALANGIISKHVGRKKSLLLSSILFLIGAVIAIFSKYTIILIMARIILGLAVGSASFTAPLFLAELTPKSIRGMTISLYQLMVNIGILIAFLSNLIFSYFQSWRSMFGILIVPSISLFCGILIIPDSPRWLASTNKTNEAIKILKKLRYSNLEVNTEIKEIVNSIKYKNNFFGWHLFKQNINFRRSVMLGIILQLIQQFTGMNVMMYFSPKIFEVSGIIETNNQFLSTCIIGLLNVLATIIAMISVDKLGRKPMLYIGFTIMAIGMSILSIGTLQFIQWLSIISLLIFVAGFAMAAGPIIWIICAEIQPLYGRDFGISCSTIANWLANMLFGTFFLTILSNLGGPRTFILLALANISFIIFTIFVIPETKGISLEQIEKNLMNGKSLRNLGK
ncbi:Galactose transporter [Candidatus Portiera aleyrodidarum]|uniref:MFS transporter, sugar porter (SP) family n=1 Tax=Candidatus Portiera aleyrodidarum TV TaxID=1297582 RepID=A0A8D4BPV1_9GAMM|nr:sugar porter family MFS transporter [Candidatus Portiera aleyrodidarum]AGI27195.1 MFS transporter, sugar porter (SP) family [Candidatus Portiera aleyrodidarum TV]CEI59179.1 Galactose transporter [Candidatus Portiera aleyrodidarum]